MICDFDLNTKKNQRSITTLRCVCVCHLFVVCLVCHSGLEITQGYKQVRWV